MTKTYSFFLSILFCLLIASPSFAVEDCHQWAEFLESRGIRTAVAIKAASLPSDIRLAQNETFVFSACSREIPKGNTTLHVSKMEHDLKYALGIACFYLSSKAQSFKFKLPAEKAFARSIIERELFKGIEHVSCIDDTMKSAYALSISGREPIVLKILNSGKFIRNYQHELYKMGRATFHNTDFDNAMAYFIEMQNVGQCEPEEIFWAGKCAFKVKNTTIASKNAKELYALKNSLSEELLEQSGDFFVELGLTAQANEMYDICVQKMMGQ